MFNGILYNTRFKPLACILLIAVYAPLFCASSKPAEVQQPSYNPYRTLAQFCMPTLAGQMIEENKKDLELVKAIAEKTTKLPPFDIAQLRVNPVEKLSMAYAILAATTTSEYSSAQDVLAEGTIRDLKLFSAQGDSKPLFDTLDNTQTTFGKIQLQKILLEPCSDIFLLEQRQLIIKNLIDNEPLLNEITTQLEKIKNVEPMFFWFWKLSSVPTIEEFNKYDGPWFNNSPFARQMWGSLANFMKLVTLGFAALSTAVSITIAINDWRREYLWGPGLLGMALTLWSGIYFFQSHRKAQSDMYAIHATMNNIALFVNTSVTLGGLVEKNTHLRILFPDYGLLKNVFQSSAAHGKELVELLSKSTFTSNPSFFSYQGRAQVAFKLFNELKDQMTQALIALGQLDAYAAIAKLYKKYAQDPKTPFCFPKYVDMDKQSLNIDNAWLPGAPESSDPRITSMAILLAQSFGIAPAQSMTLTPCNKINATTPIS